MSRELVRLDTHVPVAIDWNAGRVGHIDRPAALALFQEFGFRSIAQQLEKGAGVFAAAAVSAKSPSAGEEVVEQTAVKTPDPFTAEHRTVDTPEAFERFLAELRQQKCIAVDTETTSVWPRWAELVGMSFAWNERESWYLPLRSPAGEPHLDARTTLDALRPMLEDPAVEKVGQNLKYDAIVLRSAGVNLAGVAFDTMVASYLLDAGERIHSIDDLAHRYLGQTTIKIEELIGSGKDQQRMDEVPVARVAEYAGDDAMLPLRLRPILAKRLAEDELVDLFTKLELPLIDVLVEMEYNGIKVDVACLAELSRRYGERMDALEQEIYDLAGHPFNIASPKQLQEVLFVEHKLPVKKKTAKTGPSTDAEVLEELARLHPLPAKILEYRQYAKLKGTYVDALPQMIHPDDGPRPRLVQPGRDGHRAAEFQRPEPAEHPDPHGDGARNPLGLRARAGGLAAAGGRLFADRTAGAGPLLGRPADVRGVRPRRGHPCPGGQPSERRAAGSSNPRDEEGGQGGQLRRDLRPECLRAGPRLGIEKEAAAEFIDGYFAGYPGIEGFLNQVLAECHKKGYVSTILGRRRAIRGVRPDAGRQRNLAERTAVNTVVQGSAADLIKLAMVAIHRRLRQENLAARMLLQIHDELVFEVSPDQLPYLARLVTEEMAGVRTLSVPLKVDLRVGPNWADARNDGEPATH